MDPPGDGGRPFADFTWRHARRLAAATGLDDRTETDVATRPGRTADPRPGTAPRSAQPGRIAARTKVASHHRIDPPPAPIPLLTTGTDDPTSRRGRGGPVRGLRRPRRSRKVDMTSEPAADRTMTVPPDRPADHQGRLGRLRRRHTPSRPHCSAAETGRAAAAERADYDQMLRLDYHCRLCRWSQHPDGPDRSSPPAGG